MLQAPIFDVDGTLAATERDGLAARGSDGAVRDSRRRRHGGAQSGYTRDHHFAGALAVLSDLGEPGSSSVVHDGKLHGKAFVDLDLLRIWRREAISQS